ncbi:hypothetical protein C8F04DRAFT_1111902 [Mycena alexandri]|uniref:Uncharacterized protein n=1 Tax=Mycena alexandri TaxID=1745969 RepID=A0AAD6SPA5_9AGAR|nr:hypothetical protein C8F04DRAFT_1111902 [Mycena alexandri]
MGSSLSTHYVDNWQQECAARFNCTSPGLVDINGYGISCNTTIQAAPQVWGITFGACEESCGMGVLRQVTTIPLTTWLLPWLALIAQLPFEASDVWTDILSAFLCVGSPALATYSLALTVFNRRYITARFQALKRTVERETGPEYHFMASRVEAAAYILQESQQCPIRANQRRGELANLITMNGSHRQNFWEIAAKDLKNTRRGFTYSFGAQVFLAFVTYLISFIAAVVDSLGSPDVGLQFASSTVWSWMFPIVYGYIKVGSQYEAGCIEAALADNRIIVDPNAYGDTHRYQNGLRPNADMYKPLALRSDAESGAPPHIPAAEPAPAIPLEQIMPVEEAALPHAATIQPVASTSGSQLHQYLLVPNHDEATRSEATLAPAPDLPDRPLTPPTWCGFDIHGDERQEGPIFNYGRLFTWFAVTGHIENGFDEAIASFQRGTPVPKTTVEAARCCKWQESKDLSAFLAWSKLPGAVVKHMWMAAIAAVFLQWGTTGAAVFVAYWTPSVGIGCRSGSYLIYGVAATLSWIMLILSHLLSHEVMQRLERNPNHTSSILSFLAVSARLFGKTLAICNAMWLIASSVMEDIGYFQTCWCQTDAYQYHQSGWTPVFKGQQDLRDVAQGIWIGGFMWSIAVCLMVGAFFNGPQVSLID